MDAIIVHIDNISQLVTEINHASREQSAGIGQVNLAMTHIGEASHINADRISRSEQTAQTLREKGSHLTRLVSLFQLKSLTDPARGAQQQVVLHLFAHQRAAPGIQHHAAPRLRHGRRCVPQHLASGPE